MNKIKDFNIYILLSSFSKALIEIFVPIMLYEIGFKIEDILYFSLLKYVLIFIFNPLICIIGKLICYKWLNIISVIFFYLGYYYLFTMNTNLTSLFLLTILLVIYEHTYWVSRHYHALNLLPKVTIASNIGNILIMTQLAIIPASFIGAILIKNLDKSLLLKIICLLLFISSLFIFKINLKEKKEKKNYLKEVTNILKNIPKRSVIFLMLDQFRTIGNFFFIIYIYVYVSQSIKYIGIFNIIAGIASIIFIYLFSKKVDKNKNDYIIFSSLFVMIIWIFKLNITSSAFMLGIGLFQGLSDRMYEVSTSRNMYMLGKNYDSMTYIMVTEGIYNVARIFICLIGFLLLKDLKLFLYLCGISIFVAGLVGFNSKG